MSFNKRFIRFIIFITVVLSGLSAGVSLSHVLEIPGKHSLSVSEFLKVHHTFYGGYAIFGAVAWLYCSLAGLLTGMLFFRTIRQLAASAFIGGGGFIICLLIYALFLTHYNELIAGWHKEAPDNWQTIRNHWELVHTILFVISTISFAAFINAYKKFIAIRIVHVAH